MRSEMRSLPHPNRERWQPLRSGFVNLYRYDREEFHYENGRLLLRGNNGTGKSRVLALQLPFLLDGEVNPLRLEPDADPSKKVEWNLLLDRYPDRTGYTWIEFGRHAGNGEDSRREHYLTLGCGLSAIEGQAGVRQWFFITTQRIGRQLELVTDSKHVLGKERLREKIGSAGQVFESAGPYRRAVNEALFHLDEYRYASLVNLLIQLRRPQLTRRFEEQELSNALSEAMPPLAPAVIADVADAFRDLESDRSQLDSSKASLAAIERFLTTYRGYIEVAARRKANTVLATHDEYEAGMSEILAAEAECDRWLGELARLKTDLQRISVEQHALETEIAALQQSPQTRDAHALEQAQREANERRKDADCAAAELAEASEARESCAGEQARARANLERRNVRMVAALEAATEAAASVGLECALDPGTADDTALKQAREHLEAAIQIRSEKLGHAARLNERVAFAQNQFERARAERDQLSGLLDDALEHLNAARDEHRIAITSFLDAVADWTANLTELPLPFDEAFLRSVKEWCDVPHGPNPFALASRDAVEQLIGNLPETREAILRDEAAAAPGGENVRAAYDYAAAAARHVERLRSRLAEADEHVARRQFEAGRIAAERDRAVEDLGIARWVDDLNCAKDGITHYRLALCSLWGTIESFHEARAAGESAWTHLERATAREARQKEIAARFERQALAAQIARDAGAKAAGAGAAEILQRVADARQRLGQLHLEEKEGRRRYHETEVAVTRLDEGLRHRSETLHTQIERKEKAAASLRSFAAAELFEVAMDSPDPLAWSVELASRLDSVDAGDAAWNVQQKRIASEFSILMRELSARGYHSSATFHDDVFVATAMSGGRKCTITELERILFDDVATRQMLLDAREREILENHLVGKVSSHLRELIQTAEAQVRQMNLEIEGRPMSTGMKLRFGWRLNEDAPFGMTEARQRLSQANDAWSEAERQMLGSFLQRQIRALWSDGSGLSSAGRQEALADALDYRKWHRFTVERWQDGVWKRLTRRTHGTGSGGEKAIALTLPHFAAAAAFYRTASPVAPRLILLDEAFVGIDADMRAKCMGLINTFDLDFIMTSEREWGCYQTLPGVAIYQLSTRPGIDAVGLTRWVWNGQQRCLPPAGNLAVEERIADSVASGS
jgi:hypothetical protein